MRRGLSFGLGFGQQQAENQALHRIDASVSQSLEISEEFGVAIRLCRVRLHESTNDDHRDRGDQPHSIGEQAPHDTNKTPQTRPALASRQKNLAWVRSI